jgi:hypothetical protein
LAKIARDVINEPPDVLDGKEKYWRNSADAAAMRQAATVPGPLDGIGREELGDTASQI